MTEIRYQVLAYRPYAFSGEWVAVGCLVYAQELGHLRFVRARSLERASSLFPWGDMQALRHVFLPHIAAQSRMLSKSLPAPDQLAFEPPPRSISELSAQIIPPNDNSLLWQEEQVMRGPSLEWIGEYLERALFDRHRKEDASAPSDREVWSRRFKPSLQPEIVRFDADYVVDVRSRSFHFDYARQNGSLHLIDPASFALVNAGSITKKLDRRYGKYTQVARAHPSKQYTVYVPAAFPEDSKVSSLVVDTLEHQLGMSNMEVRVYQEADVARLKLSLQKALSYT